ncbi:MAG: hypothetical protein JW808_11810 [Victivallales bacterium]|nr:hypothetical protein [Victivallales bacterium]
MDKNCTLEEFFNKDISLRPYSYFYQAVTRSALGEDSRKKIHPVAATLKTTNNVDITKLRHKIEWSFLEAKAGTLAPDVNDKLKAVHTPPPTAEFSKPNEPIKDTLAVKLTINGNVSILDKKQVALFKDHLARDVENFQHGKKCAESVGGIQLGGADDIQVKDVGLTCGPSMTHAHKGEVSPVGMSFWNELKAEGWTKNSYSWADFLALPLQRGWKLWLGETDMGRYHPSTVLEDKTGAQALTYSGDSESKIFRHEKVEDYYNMLKAKGSEINVLNRRIWILKP